MKLTVKQHKVKALKFARRRIKSGSDEYICIALSRYPYNWLDDESEESQAIVYLKSYINKALQYSGSLEYYLKEKGHVSDASLCWGDGWRADKIHQTRLNWIDWMLECYGEKV